MNLRLRFRAKEAANKDLPQIVTEDNPAGGARADPNRRNPSKNQNPDFHSIFLTGVDRQVLQGKK